jgi:hypothetical protein
LDMKVTFLGTRQSDRRLAARRALTWTVVVAVARGLIPQEGHAADCLKWVKRTDVGSYGQRMHHAMAYDSDRGVTVFFGGEIGQGDDREYFDDTQEYDGTNWVRTLPSFPRPPSRSMHAMAYDPIRKHIVLYGGHRADGPAFGDTWIYTREGAIGKWTPSDQGIGTVAGHAMVWYPPRQVVMMQGGTDRVFNPTINPSHPFGGPAEWDGSAWKKLAFSSPGEYGLAMVFDGARNLAVAYGGFGGEDESIPTDGFYEYTFETGWRTRGRGPSARAYAAMAYDERRQRVVMVGGVGNSPEVGEEAYEYIPNEGGWITLPRLPAGLGRAGAKMVYDSRRGVMVLTGGAGGGAENADEGGRYSDTWELVPSLAITTQPASTTNEVCTEARFSVVAEGVSPFQYAWRLDGQPLSDGEHFSGSQAAALRIEGLRHEHAGNYDVVIQDSCGAPNVITSKIATLTLQPGAEWVFRTTNGPAPRFGHTLVYDRARRVTVLFGGRTNWSGLYPLNDLWEWDGARWTQRMPATVTNGWALVSGVGWQVTHRDRPVPRAHHAMAYDSRRGRVVLFGGWSLDPGGNTPVLKDLWEWDGMQWHFRATNGPMERLYPSLTYDERRGRIVLFGGQPVGPGPSDSELVWEWDGEQWHTNLPPQNPSGANSRSQSRLTYDRFRGVAVFGPTTESYSHWSFWDWDGVKWTTFPVLHFTDPIVTMLHGTSLGGFSFDVNRRRSTWFGGIQAAPVNHTAFFDGKHWTLLTNSSAFPAARVHPAMTYDSDRHVHVMFGGSLNYGTALGATNDTWELAAVDVPLLNEQPASQYRKAGERATFAGQAVGPGSLSYQWYRGDVSLAGGSDTLTIPAVRAQDAGVYRVRVSSPCGQTWSRSAILTLDPKLQIFSADNSTTLVWEPDPKVVLEVADRVQGPWTIVPKPPIPFSVSALGPGKFFRLRQVN